ncbi:hypothetical protein HDV05_007152 [Chytridiales sp. JEL 0842]|nr:hypothetical protein HDV05_007152 [Chytridiales sp. JEL 0842]
MSRIPSSWAASCASRASTSSAKAPFNAAGHTVRSITTMASRIQMSINTMHKTWINPAQQTTYSSHRHSPTTYSTTTRSLATTTSTSEEPVVPPLVSPSWLASALKSSPSPTTKGARIIPVSASYYTPISRRVKKKTEEMLSPKEKMKKSLFPWSEVADEGDITFGARGGEEQGDDEVALEDVGRDARTEFEERRIEGSIYFDFERFSDPMSSMQNILPLPTDFAATMNELEISNDDHIVVYDSLGLLTSPRAWFIFKAMGHQKVSVLNGGLTKWIHEGHPTVSGPPSPSITPASQDFNFDEPLKDSNYVATFTDSIALDYPAMLVHATDYLYANSASIIDVRPPLRFQGKIAEPLPNVRSGSIPGSINVFWQDLLKIDQSSGSVVLKDPMEIIKVFKNERVDLDRDLVLLGTDGFTPAIAFLALEVLGKTKGVGLYDGGWIEYARKPKSPIRSRY